MLEHITAVNGEHITAVNCCAVAARLLGIAVELLYGRRPLDRETLRLVIYARISIFIT